MSDLELARLNRGEEARGEAESHDENRTDHEIPRRKIEHGHASPRRISERNQSPGEGETRETADRGDEERLPEDQTQDLSVRESKGLEDGELARALAHGLRHGVARHEQDGEEHRAENGLHDRTDVS